MCVHCQSFLHVHDAFATVLSLFPIPELKSGLRCILILSLGLFISYIDTTE